MASGLALPEVARAQIGVNLIPNLSFEDDADANGLPDDWYIETALDGTDIGYSDVDPPPCVEPHTGQRCLTLTVPYDQDNPNRKGDLVLHLRKATRIDVVPGATYRLSMHYRMDEVIEHPLSGEETGYDLGSGRIKISMLWYDGPANDENAKLLPFNPYHYGSVNSLYGSLTSSNWLRAERDNTPVAPAASAALRIEVIPELVGTVSIDDISLVELVTADLTDLKQPGTLAFDFVGEDGEEAPGFTAAPFDQAFQVGGFGFEEFYPNSTRANDQFGYPTPLQSQNGAETAFKVTVNDGDYRVSLYMGGYWRTELGWENHRVDFNGQRRIDENVPFNNLVDQIYFGRVHDTLVTGDTVVRKGHAVYDAYIKPRYRRHDVDVTVTDGVLEIRPISGLMAGVVITPAQYRSEHDRAMDTYDDQLTEDFVTHWAVYREPSEFGLPIVSGDYDPADSPEETRGYALFRRHWMDFVEHTSRPDSGDVIDAGHPGLSLTATPGEYEPVTFSIWPLGNLNAVTITSSALQEPGGAVIPASAVRIWYLQQKPLRYARPATSFGLIGTFLPDWGVRDLYQNITQRAWLNVHVPERTPPGSYDGQIRVTPSNAEATTIPIRVEVLPFELVRPERLHVMRYGGASVLVPFSAGSDKEEADPTDPYDKEFYRKAAIDDLWNHGFTPEIRPFFEGWFDRDTGEMDWARRSIDGSANDQIDRIKDSDFYTANPNRRIAWVTALGVEPQIINAFRCALENPPCVPAPGEWTVAYTRDLLAEIHDHLVDNTVDEYDFTEVYLYGTGEESHFTNQEEQEAWAAYMHDVVQGPRSDEWRPELRYSHTVNTDWGRPIALAGADHVNLGIFHGTDGSQQQLLEAEASPKGYGLYGVRGRYVPGFYHWRTGSEAGKRGASGSLHEFYAHYQGALNNDWDNRISDSFWRGIIGESPGWSNAVYSQTGRMIGSWFWEEMREGVDDEAYLNTLEWWIASAAGDPRDSVSTARNAASEVLTAIASKIHLGVDSSISGSFRRKGLSLYRPVLQDVAEPQLDTLRQQAAQAVVALKAAVEAP
jgi:hypothetical protein